MEFTFTEEQRLIADLAANVFGAHGSDEYLAKLADNDVTFDAELWGNLSRTGLLNLALSTENGGSGFGMTELGLVLQQQGRYVAVVPFWQHQLAGLAVEKHGKEQLKQRVLPKLSCGEQATALATEFNHHISLFASHQPDGWILNGSFAAVLIDQSHSWLLIPAGTEQGPRLFLIPSAQDGITKTCGVLTDLQSVSDLTFDNVVVPTDSDLAPAALEWIEPRVALCIASLQLGALVEALQRAADYVSERHQFGRPLGSFQALAVRAADAYIEVELLRSAQWQLAWRLDQGLSATAAAHVAKHHASKAGFIVGHTVQHFHGGVGADLRYPIHRFYLKSQALAAIGGGAEAQLARIGRALASESFKEFIHD